MGLLNLLAVPVFILPILNSSLSAAEPAAHYRLTRSVSLGAPDRWDYLVFDPSSHRVFIAHGDRVTVVDGVDGSIVGQVEGFPGGTHGIAIVPTLGVGYTDDGRAGQAGAFDLNSFKTLARVPTAQDADSMAFDPVSGHIFVINGDGGSITVIDPKRAAAVATIQTGAGLEYAVTDDRGKLYVNGAEKKQIIRIDTGSNSIDARWPVPTCSSPHGLAIDGAAHRLFSTCVNNLMMVVDTDSGAIVASLPIGSGTDAAAFDPKRRLIFSSNGRDGTLSVIREVDAQTFRPAGTVQTALSARTMTIDPASGRLYLAAAQVRPPPPGSPAGARPAVIPGTLELRFYDPE